MHFDTIPPAVVATFDQQKARLRDATLAVLAETDGMKWLNQFVQFLMRPTQQGFQDLGPEALPFMASLALSALPEHLAGVESSLIVANSGGELY